MLFLETSARGEAIVAPYVADDRKFGGKRSPRWEALLKLFSNPWFERVWVVQEVAVAPAILVRYGGLYVPWEALITVLLAFVYPGSIYTPTITGKVDN
jgi:hypothetical protein